jgi:hypothetical protein
VTIRAWEPLQRAQRGDLIWFRLGVGLAAGFRVAAGRRSAETLLNIGFGINFSYATARRVIDAEVLPHIISSDVHGGRIMRPPGPSPATFVWCWKGTW